MMAVLTQDAQHHLDRYLRRVKAALHGHQSVDVVDVERDVLGHIDEELAGQPEPVDAGALLPVLDRLGAPDSWVPEDDLPPWRRILSRLRSGPEEWRLAYLTMGLFFGGLLFFLAGPFLWPLEPLMVLTSILTARAALSLLAEHDEPVGARRWFFYPPLATAYLPLLVILLSWPAPLVFASGEGDMPAIEAWLTRIGGDPFLGAVLIVPVALGLWWTVLGLAVARRTDVVRAAFYPFVDWFEPRHARRVAVVGLAVAAIGGMLLLL